tara:strand:+ start:1942 stop:3345 length:1404 start_codon:yes stop_codon:yes gene_type:complete
MATPDYINTALGLFAISKEVTPGLPNYQFKVSASAGATDIQINTSAGSGRDDLNANGAAASFFVGAQVYFTSGALAGKVYDVTSSTAGSSGTLTMVTSTMAATPSGGDDFLMFFPLPASNVTMNVSTENLERDFVRQTLDKPSGLKGLKMCDGSFDVEIPGMVTASSSGSAPAIDRFSALLSVVGTRKAAVATVQSGGTASTTQASVASVGTLAVNDVVLIENQARVITDVTGSTITWAPALSATITGGATIYTGEQWEAADDSHQTLTILNIKDDRLEEARGAACSVNLSGEFGQMLTASVEFSAAYMASGGAESGWDLQDSFTIDGSQASKKPPVFKTSAASHFDGVKMDVASFEFALGHERSEHRYVDTHYHTINARNATCSVNWKDTTAYPKETWEATGTVAQLIMAAGKSAGDCVAVSGNAQIYDPVTNAENNSFQDWNGTFAFCDDQTDAATAKRPMIVRF